jgi:cystathionine beta-lyase/cystathionine gamma-synthase
MSRNGRPNLATLLVHAGERLDVPVGLPVSTPIYSTATFTYETMAEVDRVFAGEQPGYVYTRYGNPTVAALEEAMRQLEGGAAACAYASGMAALHASLLSCELRSGSVILASQDLYGATLDLLNRIFGPFGVRTETADFCDLESVAAKAADLHPQAFVVETISNPLLRVCDLPACAEVARRFGARLIVDNTFATPYLCTPIEYGADFVVHSATKYLSGHADVMGGMVIAREQADLPALISIMKLVGGVLGPFEAHEILRGIKTLGLRLERQCVNAGRLAQSLSHDHRIARVHYPGLIKGREGLPRRILRAPHAGALISLELKEDTREAAFQFMDALRLCVRCTSVGDIFTEVLRPATASHREMGPSRRRQVGISDSLVRISVGIEDIEDILADVDRALASCSPSASATG